MSIPTRPKAWTARWRRWGSSRLVRCSWVSLRWAWSPSASTPCSAPAGFASSPDRLAYQIGIESGAQGDDDYIGKQEHAHVQAQADTRRAAHDHQLTQTVYHV